MKSFINQKGEVLQFPADININKMVKILKTHHLHKVKGKHIEKSQIIS